MPPRKPKDKRGVYDAKEVDDLIVAFEQAYKKWDANKGSRVRKISAEKDMYRCAENIRDLLKRAEGGTKAKLEEVFGGSCVRFHRLNNVRKMMVFDSTPDPRWKEMSDEMFNVEEILKQIGCFQPWVEILPPTSLTYEDFPEWLADDTEIYFEPIVTGSEPGTVFFEINKPLPDGLTFDRKTGVISGSPAADIEVPQTEIVVTGSNMAGEIKKTLNFGVKAFAPESLVYNVDESVMVGSSIDWGPKSTGGKVRKWTIDRDLPKGLMLDPKSGAIYGMPFKATEECTYKITGSNVAGTVEAEFTFGVTAAPPVGLQYPDLKGSDFNVGQTISIAPEVEMKTPEGGSQKVTMGRQGASRGSVMTEMPERPGLPLKMATGLTSGSTANAWGRGHADNGAFQGTRWNRRRNSQFETSMALGMQPDITFSIVPELPEGLHLSKTTGLISGMCKGTHPKKAYKVTAMNDSGEVSTTINFGIINVPPRGLHYPDAVEVVYEGQPLSFTPEVDGVVTTWKIEPDLCNGLSIDSNFGTISGVPEGTSPLTSYKITGANEAGSAESVVAFKVQHEPPASISYTPNRLSYPWETDLEMTSQCMSSGLRAVGCDTWSVEPALPKGMSMCPKTGRIYGRPTEVTPENSYVVTATNESGSCTLPLVFDIKEMPPHELTFPGIDDDYFIGEKMKETPQLIGGATAWSIEPALPKGMSLDEKTGVISGTPEELTPEKDYNITASNNAGGTSIVVNFEVAAPAPTKIAYPEIGASLQIGHNLTCHPVVAPSPAGATFKIEPALPAGLKFDESTGTISGSPSAAVPRADYQVTVTNPLGSAACKLNFETCDKPDDPMAVDQAWAAALMECVDVTDLPPEPDRQLRLADWMVWMCHRAWLNDPTLVIFDFSNMRMPLSIEEPRVAPKLMKALATNSSITSLLLPNTNFQNPEAIMMGDALSTNTTLEVINIETNYIDPDGVLAIATALREHTGAEVNTLRMANQLKTNNFGRAAEEAISLMLEKNEKITKCGFSANDAHWKNNISRWLTKNGDIARRKRKLAKGIVDKPVEATAISKALTKVILESTPDKAVWEIFEAENDKFEVVRRFMSEQGKMPTREQLQAFAKKLEINLPYGKVAPLLKEFRTELFKAICGKDVTCWDDSNKNFEGTMKAFTEKNDRINLDVFGKPSGRWDFAAQKQPVIELSEQFAEWIYNGIDPQP